MSSSDEGLTLSQFKENLSGIYRKLTSNSVGQDTPKNFEVPNECFESEPVTASPKATKRQRMECDRAGALLSNALYQARGGLVLQKESMSAGNDQELRQR